MLRKLAIALAALFIGAPAFGQAVQQSGPVTRNHLPYWISSGVVGDAGTSADSPVSSLGITNNGGNGICVNSARIASGAWNSLCLGASTSGPAIISLQNYGTAPAESLEFLINGTVLTPATLPIASTNQLYGGSGVAGVASVISLGTNLSITGGVLNATGGGGGGTPCTVTALSLQYNNAGAFGCTTAITFTGSGQLSIGTPGTTLGSLKFGNLTSGTVTLQPTAGTLGANVLQLPAATDTIAVLGNITTALPNATTSQLYGGSGGAGIASIVNVGSGLSLTGSTLTATGGGGGGTGTAQRKTFYASSDFTPGSTTSLTLPFTPTAASALWIWFDGAYQDSYTYSLAGAVLTFGAAIPSNVQVVEASAGVATGAFSPGGSNTDIQFQCGGVFCGNAGLTFDGTSKITAGVAGSSTGALVLSNTTSGTLTVQPPATGALFSGVLTLPIGTSTLAATGIVQSWTAAQTFANNDLAILGSSTGSTILASANATGTNYTATFPANSGTVAELNLAQAFTAAQTFPASGMNLLGTSTGYTTFTSANTTATLYTITFPASSGTVLTTAAAITVPQGGTGQTALTAYAPIFGGTSSTGAVQSGTVGSTGQVLTSNGAGALPTFQSPSSIYGNLPNAVAETTFCNTVGHPVDPTFTSDSTAGINACIAHWGVISLPTGTFKISGSQGIIISANNQGIVGVHQTTILKQTTTTGNVITLTGGANWILQGLYLDRSVTASGGGGIGFTGAGCNNCVYRDIYATNQWDGFDIAPAAYGIIDGLTAYANLHHGFYFTATNSYTGNQYVMTNTSSFQNVGYGFWTDTGGLSSTYTTWNQATNIGTFANCGGGTGFNATSGSSISDIRISNYNGSGSGIDEFYLNTNGEHNVISLGLIEGAGIGSGGKCGPGLAMSASNAGYGVALVNNSEVIIDKLAIRQSANSGILVGGGSGTNISTIISNNQISDNNNNATAGDSGIFIAGTVTTVVVTGNGGEGGGTQKYGIFNSVGSTSTTTVTGNVFNGNVTAGCGGNAVTKVGNIGTGC